MGISSTGFQIAFFFIFMHTEYRFQGAVDFFTNQRYWIAETDLYPKSGIYPVQAASNISTLDNKSAILNGFRIKYRAPDASAISWFIISADINNTGGTESA